MEIRCSSSESTQVLQIRPSCIEGYLEVSPLGALLYNFESLGAWAVDCHLRRLHLAPFKNWHRPSTQGNDDGDPLSTRLNGTNPWHVEIEPLEPERSHVHLD